MSNKKASKNIWLHIMGALAFLELVVCFMTISKESLLRDLTRLIPLVFVALYGFWLYKKPHGNLLKYAILIFAALQILNAIQCIKGGWDATYVQTVRVFGATILVYVAGRLNRIERNKYLLPIAAIIFFVSSCVSIATLSGSFSPIYMLTWFSGPITILTLMIAYFVRFKEHKEAGLMDAPKEK